MRAHPYSDHPRQFTALAMPAGDPQFGVVGPLVQVLEHNSTLIRSQRFYSEAEARSLMEALQCALRDLAGGRRWRAEGGAPRAAEGHYPFSHPTLAEVDAAGSAQLQTQESV